MIMERMQRVMFVDDEEGVRQSWDRLLRERGFAVSTAEDGAGAQARLEEEPADVVVADLRMPRVDGLQLLEWVRREQPETRFILVTGYGSEAVEQRARELGAFDYLSKPVNPETLSAVITSAMQVDVRTLQVAAKPAIVEVQAEVMTPTQEEVAPAPEVVRRGRLRGAAEVVGGLIMAPLMGLAFVLFLPLLGFGGLFWAVGEKIWKRVGAARA
jgi:DNA-binding NtrC family response regulator